MAVVVGNDTPAHHSVLIIGAGQAGLSVSWHLTQTGIPHAVFDRAGPLNGKQTVSLGPFRSNPLGTDYMHCDVAICLESYLLVAHKGSLAPLVASFGSDILQLSHGAPTCISMAQRSMGLVLPGHSELDGPAPRETLRRS
jgi:hypothetical protein